MTISDTHIPCFGPGWQQWDISDSKRYMVPQPVLKDRRYWKKVLKDKSQKLGEASREIENETLGGRMLKKGDEHWLSTKVGRQREN